LDGPWFRHSSRKPRGGDGHQVHGRGGAGRSFPKPLRPWQCNPESVAKNETLPVVPSMVFCATSPIFRHELSPRTPRLPGDTRGDTHVPGQALGEHGLPPKRGCSRVLAPPRLAALAKFIGNRHHDRELERPAKWIWIPVPRQGGGTVMVNGQLELPSNLAGHKGGSHADAPPVPESTPGRRRVSLTLVSTDCGPSLCLHPC